MAVLKLGNQSSPIFWYVLSGTYILRQSKYIASMCFMAFRVVWSFTAFMRVVKYFHNFQLWYLSCVERFYYHVRQQEIWEISIFARLSLKILIIQSIFIIFEAFTIMYALNDKLSDEVNFQSFTSALRLLGWWPCALQLQLFFFVLRAEPVIFGGPVGKQCLYLIRIFYCGTFQASFSFNLHFFSFYSFRTRLILFY